MGVRRSCGDVISSTSGVNAFCGKCRSRVANPSELRPGDALNKPGSHVMLFLRFTPDRMAEVMESSTGGCSGRVCRNVYPLASLLARGYKPVRFRALENVQVAEVAFPDSKKPEAVKAETRKTETRKSAADDRPVRHHKKHK